MPLLALVVQKIPFHCGDTAKHFDSQGKEELAKADILKTDFGNPND